MAVRWVFQSGWYFWLTLTLSGVLSGGAVARAGCGDHPRAVFFPIESGFQVADFGQFPSELATTPLPADAPRPCTGPSCSRQPAAPRAIPAPDRPPTDSGLDWIRAIPPHTLAARPVIVRAWAQYASPAVAPLDRPPRP